MILLGEDGRIISLNSAAAKILQVRVPGRGKSLVEVCRDLTLNEMVEDAGKGRKREKLFSFGGRRYQVSATPMLSSEKYLYKTIPMRLLVLVRQ